MFILKYSPSPLAIIGSALNVGSINHPSCHGPCCGFEVGTLDPGLTHSSRGKLRLSGALLCNEGRWNQEQWLQEKIGGEGVDIY